MPLHKTPLPLYKLCLKEVDILMVKACININECYGNYESESCRAATEELHNYLVPNIPGTLLDDMCDFRRFSSHNLKLSDPRIHLSILMHDNMKRFLIFDGSEERKIGIDDSFWISQISKLQNIVVLNMNLVCTDEILEIVSKTCLKLEKINIVSRVEPEKGKYSTFPFNALKLKYFVSDEGLQHLKNCRQLKIITMNKIVRSHGGGRKITPAGIRDLVKSLPQLQSISYTYMGAVLGEGTKDVKYLPLTSVTDFLATTKHTQAIVRICPDLHNLSLRVHSDSEVPEILRALTNSNLRLNVLELLGFPFCDEMISFLVAKGEFLNNLSLQTGNILEPKHIKIIGATCPNLKTLCLQERDRRKYDGRVCEAPSFSTPNSHAPFSNLECLKIDGTGWIPKGIVATILTNADHIEKLVLFKRNQVEEIDAVIFQILEVNKLTYLKKLYLLLGCSIKVSTIVQLAKNCASLKLLAFSKFNDEGSKDLEDLKSYIKKLNLDIEVCPFELG